MPAVYVVAGAAGSGKSTVGRALARRTGAVVLDQDILTNPLMAQIARSAGVTDHDFDHPALADPGVRQARYQCLLDTGRDNVDIGRTVVLVAPFTREVADRAAWHQLCFSFAPLPVTLLWVTTPPHVLRERRRRRGLPRDLAADLTVDRVVPDPVVEHFAIDGTLSAELALRHLPLG